jgi:hypothetical protein
LTRLLRFDAVTLHQFDALVQSFTEHRRRVFFEVLYQARIARPYLKRLRVGEWRVHEITLSRNKLQVGLQLLRGLLCDSKN